MAGASTQEKKTDIQIFVSHRIDLDSETIDNPLYIPMRCGAVYDQREGVALRGDDTGDHISEKRLSFNEFTVQYWAWKNAAADYIGLCHYRRYLSFTHETYRTNRHGLVPYALLSRSAMQRFGLLNENTMRREIESYDIITPHPVHVRRMALPGQFSQTVHSLWKAHEGFFFEDTVIDCVFALIDRLAPEYSASARRYFAQPYHYGCCCYIMARSLFERLCALQFPVMDAIERQFTPSRYTDERIRTPAYVGEMLYGIFLYHVLHHTAWRVRQKQLVFFMETKKVRCLRDVLRCHAVCLADQAAETIAAPFFPLGSKRREFCKAVYRFIVR